MGKESNRPFVIIPISRELNPNFAVLGISFVAIWRSQGSISRMRLKNIPIMLILGDQCIQNLKRKIIKIAYNYYLLLENTTREIFPKRKSNKPSAAHCYFPLFLPAFSILFVDMKNPHYY